MQLQMRLDVVEPFDQAAMRTFLVHHAVDGVEWLDGEAYCRTLQLPAGPATIRLELASDHVGCTLDLTDRSDLATAVARCRALLDLDADPIAVSGVLGADPVMAPIISRQAGIRVPGHVDGFELAVRTVVGQQVSVAGANTTVGRLVRTYGRETGSDRWLFPTAGTLADADPDRLGMPRQRGRAVVALAAAVAGGSLWLDGTVDPGETHRHLLALPGIGPWSAGYIAIRALRDPDILLDTDLVVRRAMRDLDVSGEQAATWAPWRSYATMHLWRHALTTMKER